MLYLNTVVFKVQKGFNASALLRQGFQLQACLDNKCIGFSAMMEQTGKDVFEELLKLEKIQKLLVYQKRDFVLHANRNFPYDEQFMGYLYLKHPTWALPCHKLFYAPTWDYVSSELAAYRDEPKVQKKIDQKMFALLENKAPGAGWYMSALDEEEVWKIYAALKH